MAGLASSHYWRLSWVATDGLPSPLRCCPSSVRGGEVKAGAIHYHLFLPCLPVAKTPKSLGHLLMMSSYVAATVTHCGIVYTTVMSSKLLSLLSKQSGGLSNMYVRVRKRQRYMSWSHISWVSSRVARERLWQRTFAGGILCLISGRLIVAVWLHDWPVLERDEVSCLRQWARVMVCSELQRRKWSDVCERASQWQYRACGIFLFRSGVLLVPKILFTSHTHVHYALALWRWRWVFLSISFYSFFTLAGMLWKIIPCTHTPVQTHAHTHACTHTHTIFR